MTDKNLNLDRAMGEFVGRPFQAPGPMSWYICQRCGHNNFPADFCSCDYSTDRDDVWIVIERILQLDRELILTGRNDGWYVAEIRERGCRGIADVASSIEEAICRAALAIMGGHDET